MMSNKVLENSLIYSLSGILLKCFSFLLLPLYTAYLTTEDYGITNLVNSFVTSMSFVIAFSLFSAVMRFYVDLKDDEVCLRRFYGTVSLFVYISGVVFFGIFFLFKQFLTKCFFPGIDFYPVVFIGLISLIFSCQYNIFDTILRSQQKAMQSSIASILFFFFTLGLNIVFVVLFRKGVTGVLLSTLFGYIVYTVYFICTMYRDGFIEFCLDWNLLKSALKYSVPIIPHNISTHIAVFVSSLFIGQSVSLSGLGIYSVATQFGSVADTIQGYVDKAYGPWLYEQLKVGAQEYKNKIRQIVVLLLDVIGLFFIGLALFSQEAVYLMVNENYWDAWRYIPFIVLIFTIKMVYYFYVEILFYFKEASRKLFIATVTGSLLNVILSVFMIPQYGIYGAIAANAIAMFVRVGIIIGISRMYEDTGIVISDFIKSFFLIASTIMIGFGVECNYSGGFSFVCLGIKTLIVCCYLCIVIYMNKNFVGLIRNYLSKRVGKFA